MSRSVRNRSTNEAEVDGVGALEADRLDGDGCLSATQVSEVFGEHHVAAAFENSVLVLHGMRGLAEVGRRDDVEDRIGVCDDLRLDGSEWPESSPDTQVRTPRTMRT